MTTEPILLPPGRGRPISRSYKVAITLAVAFAVFMASGSMRPFVYQEACQLARWQLQRQLNDWPSIESEHFIVKYQPTDENAAAIVLKAAEKAYSIVTQEVDFVPPGKTLVVVHPTAEELNSAFGWSSQESAVGAYWGGAIRVLSPSAWIGDTSLELVKEIFWAAGPMVHEFTHLVLDYKTAGNYPRWFSEGLAQYLELKHCGTTLSSGFDLHLKQLYSIQELGNFSQLDDELLAYEQALSIVQYLTDIYGPQIIEQIVNSLAQGQSFPRALKTAGIKSPAALEEAWLQWLQLPAGI
ncbi:MAG: hypothetical protein GX489_06835 [Firmicutes bacterium]|nr:hypothetical protein [Bacillota bacterium]